MNKFKKNQKVMIYNSTLSGELIEEGYATLVKNLGDNQWLVKFPEDSGTYERNVMFGRNKTLDGIIS